MICGPRGAAMLAASPRSKGNNLNWGPKPSSPLMDQKGRLEDRRACGPISGRWIVCGGQGNRAPGQGRAPVTFGENGGPGGCTSHLGNGQTPFAVLAGPAPAPSRRGPAGSSCSFSPGLNWRSALWVHAAAGGDLGHRFSGDDRAPTPGMPRVDAGRSNNGRDADERERPEMDFNPGRMGRPGMAVSRRRPALICRGQGRAGKGRRPTTRTSRCG